MITVVITLVAVVLIERYTGKPFMEAVSDLKDLIISKISSK